METSLPGGKVDKNKHPRFVKALKLIFTTLWANLTDDKLMTFLIFFLRSHFACDLIAYFQGGGGGGGLEGGEYFKMSSAEIFIQHAKHLDGNGYTFKGNNSNIDLSACSLRAAETSLNNNS